MEAELKVETKENNDEAVVIAAGEIDISNVARFRQAIENAERAKPVSFSIDLCGVTFVDTAGLAELIVAAKRLKARDETLRVIVQDSGQPEYVLKTTGLSVILDICHPTSS